MTSKPPSEWMRPAPPPLLEGDEPFHGVEVAVMDFWRWAFSDLRSNTVRGVLAEFLVAVALRRTGLRRKEWDNYDVESESGVRVEVKASGYLQSWPQTNHSQLNFGRVAARAWNIDTNEFGLEPEVRADVFVFAVQTCKDHAKYDALDVSQWEFYVVPAQPVRDSGHKSLAISWVRRNAQPIGFDHLVTAIERASREP